jgi:hypothetical protein
MPTNAIDPDGLTTLSLPTGLTITAGEASSFAAGGAATMASYIVFMISVQGIKNAIENIKKNYQQMKMNDCILAALEKWNNCRSDAWACDPEASNPAKLNNKLDWCDHEFRQDIEKCMKKYPGSKVYIDQIDY